MGYCLLLEFLIIKKAPFKGCDLGRRAAEANEAWRGMVQ